MTEMIMEVLQGALFVAGIYVVTKGIKIANDYVDTLQAEKIDNKHVNELIDLVQSCTNMTTQTYVDSLKQSGSFDEAAQEVAMSRTLTSIKKFISTDLADYLQDKYDDLDEYLRTQVESYINMMKK